MSGSQNYNIANLWMHAIAVGFNASWFDSNCGSMTFQLMDNRWFWKYCPQSQRLFYSDNDRNQKFQAIVNGGLYSASDCSDAVVASKNLSITSGASSTVVYMKKLMSWREFCECLSFLLRSLFFDSPKWKHSHWHELRLVPTSGWWRRLCLFPYPLPGVDVMGGGVFLIQQLFPLAVQWIKLSPLQTRQELLFL